MKIIENFKLMDGDIERELLFKKLAMDAVAELNLEKFTNNGLELARSEKEIAKCQKIKENKIRKQELAEKDIEIRAKSKKEDTESFEKKIKRGKKDNLQVRKKFNKFKKNKDKKNRKK